MSLRSGGVSRPPYDSLNLGLHVGDDPADVERNRERFSAALGMPLARLQQVHGAEVVTLARAIQESVYGRFGIRLEPEPVVLS